MRTMFFKRPATKQAFTLLEVIITVVIIGILATMTVVFLSGDYNKQRKCMENLEIISKAIEKYRDANGQYPPDGMPGTGQSLKDALYPTHISDESIFKCPADTSNDSYSLFYVKRNDYSSIGAFSLGCPRHDAGKTAINLFFQGQIIKEKLAEVGDLRPGDTMTGLVTFADDGSTANINGEAMLLQSFYIGAGKCYTLIKVTQDETAVDCSIASGSKFEIITSSAIAGVGGTEFRLIAASGLPRTYVAVKEGEVVVCERNGIGGPHRTQENKISRVISGSSPEDVTDDDADAYVAELKAWLAN